MDNTKSEEEVINKLYTKDDVYKLLYDALTSDGPGAFNMGWDSDDAHNWIEQNL